MKLKEALECCEEELAGMPMSSIVDVEETRIKLISYLGVSVWLKPFILR